MAKTDKEVRLDIILGRYYDEEFLKADGFDDAIIGVCYRTKNLVYSIKKCMHILVVEEGMKHIDALEHMSYNVLGSYVGENTPIFVDDEW